VGTDEAAQRAEEEPKRRIIEEADVEMDSEQPPKDDDKKVQLADLPIASIIEP
ncbi:hypothetical protein AAVH_40168, partial [Aphelenchoides avenae]